MVAWLDRSSAHQGNSRGLPRPPRFSSNLYVINRSDIQLSHYSCCYAYYCYYYYYDTYDDYDCTMKHPILERIT